MLRNLIPNIFNPRYWQETLAQARLALALLRDPRVPGRLKLIPFFMLVYVLSPFDLIPAYIPILGQMDDLAIVLLGLRAFVSLAPPEVANELKARLAQRRV